MATILPKIILDDKEEEKKTELPKIVLENNITELPNINSNVLKGSVLEKFDDEGKEIKVGIVDKVKNFFKKDELPKIPEFEDPILQQIYEIEKEYHPESFWEGYKEQVLFRTYVGTARDVAQATIDVSNYLGKKIPGINDNVIDTKLPEVKEPNYFSGSLQRDLIGFMGGYSAVGKTGQVVPFIKNIPNAKSKVSKFFRVVTKGGLAEQFTFSPYEKRLSNLVETYKDEKFSNSVTEYLQAKDTDSEDEARAKMFAEGAILAIPLEVLFWSIGKSYRSITGKKGDKELDIELKAKQNDTDETVNIETKDIKPIKWLAENDIVKLKDNKPKIIKLKKELEKLESEDVPLIETKIKVSKNAQTTIKNNNSQIKSLNKQIEVLEKKQIKVNNRPNSVPIKEFISFPEKITTLKQKVAKLELQNSSIKTKKITPDLKKTEIRTKKIEKIVNQLRPLEVEQKIYENTRVKVDPTEITKLRKELKEARAIKVERTVETFNTADGKVKKVVTTDNVIATRKKNKISDIQAKIKKLEEETTIKNQRQAKLDRADIDEKIGSKPRQLEGLDIPEGVSVKGLNTATLKKITQAAEELLTTGKVTRNPTLKLYEQISDLLYTGRLSNEQIEAILKKYNITLKEFAQFFGATTAQAGRTLQLLSVIQKKLNQIEKIEGSNKAWVKALDESGDGFYHHVMSVFKRLDNVRRAIMVSQLATAVRNLESQTFKQGISVIQEAVEKVFQLAHKKLFPNAPIKRVTTPLNTLSGFARIFKQFNPIVANKIKKEVDLILSSFPKEGDKLFLRFSSDITNMSGKKITFSPLRGLEKVADLLNIFNKAQEFITRRAVFQARLNNLILNSPGHYGNRTLRQIIDQGDTAIIRKQDVADSVSEALDSTFAKDFNKFDGIYDNFAYKFIQLANAIPFTVSLILPFPRFLMNSLKFHIDFSPLGLIPFFTKKNFKKMADGDYSQISKVAIGTAMLTTAYMMRKQDYVGEKWYEFKFGDRYIDVRPFNPFVAYLYVADLMIRAENGTLRDLDLKGIASVFLGSRAGTGLYLIDKFIDHQTGNKPVEDKLQSAKVILGSIMSTYLTPLQTALDFMAENDPELAIVRDSRKDPLWGQIKKKISPEDLPPIYSATSIEYTKAGIPVAKTIVRESPGYRQVTGMSIIPKKNEAEKMLDKNGFLPQEIFRSTGIPELDKAIKMQLAPKIAIQLSTVVSLPFFKKLDVPTQNYIIKKQLTKYKKQAGETIRNDSSIAAYLLEYRINKIPKDKRAIIDEYLGKDFLFELKKEFQSGKKTKLPDIKLD
jgi:hypothetical protein